MEEVWKQLILNKKETKYEVSCLGGVRNKDTQENIGQVLSGIPQYKYVNIKEECGTRKLRRVHRLVAMMFIPKVEGKKLVDHIDRDKLNNRVDNLRWVTINENQANRDGTLMYNKDVADILGMDYGVVSCRLDNGWTIDQIRLGYIPLFYYEGKPYKHYGDFRKEIKMDKRLFSTLRYEGKSLKEIKDYVKRNTQMVEAFGTLTFISVHCKNYNTTPDKVKFGMDKGLSLEEALLSPPQKVRKHSVNGVVMKNKDMWIMYGLEPKNTTTKLSKLKCVYKTLEHFGIDTTDLIIEPYLL